MLDKLVPIRAHEVKSISLEHAQCVLGSSGCAVTIMDIKGEPVFKKGKLSCKIKERNKKGKKPDLSSYPKSCLKYFHSHHQNILLKTQKKVNRKGNYKRNEMTISSHAIKSHLILIYNKVSSD